MMDYLTRVRVSALKQQSIDGEVTNKSPCLSSGQGSINNSPSLTSERQHHQRGIDSGQINRDVVQSQVRGGIDGRRVSSQGSITDQKVTDGGIKRPRFEVKVGGAGIFN